MENITFSLADMHRHGSAFYDYLGLRKRFFVDNLGWNIPHDDQVEMDQYDNPKASYSLVLRDGEVVGGARIMPTTAKWGTHTYMLRDAVQGKLIDIPPSVLGRDIVDEDLWECTRLVIDDSVQTHADRSTCLALIVDGLIDDIDKLKTNLKDMQSKSPINLGQMSFNDGNYSGEAFTLSRASWNVDVRFNLFNTLGTNTSTIRNVIIFAAMLMAAFIILSSGRKGS